MQRLLLFLSVPGALAAIVGARELYSSAKLTDKVKRLAPVLFVFAALATFYFSDRIIDPASSPYVPWLAYSMATLSALAALSGLLVRYSAKTDAILMGVAGFLVAFYWAFLYIPRA